MNNKRNTILITGATDGIGLALAKYYLSRNQNLVLIGRKNISDLDSTIFTSKNYCKSDLSLANCSGPVVEFIEHLKINRIDYIIHNAAIGHYGRNNESIDSVNDLIKVNVWAPMALTHQLFPFLSKENGKLIFISSVVSHIACPNYAVYGATKSALDGFARSLRAELQGQIKVMIIHPGATHTGMHSKMEIPTSVMNWQKFPSARYTAVKIAKAIERKSTQATIGLPNKSIRILGHFFPILIDNLQRLKNISDRENFLMSPKKESPICAITGFADGIGRSLAHQYAKNGYDVIGIDMDKIRAEKTIIELKKHNINATYLLADLSTNSGLTTVESKLESSKTIDVFIHNAGINCTGRFIDSDLTNQENVLRINLQAPIRITLSLLKQKKLTDGGSLVFISSLSKYVSYPSATVYAATKDGLASYARSLRISLHPNINILTVFPGPTRTEHARRYSPDNSNEHKRMNPEDLAKKIYNAEKSKQRLLVPGVSNKLCAILGYFFPRIFENAMSKLFLK